MTDTFSICYSGSIVRTIVTLFDVDERYNKMNGKVVSNKIFEGAHRRYDGAGKSDFSLSVDTHHLRPGSAIS